MKFLTDFFPILLFFITYKWQGIYTATMVAIAASFIQIALFWLKSKRVESSHLTTFVMVVIFGGATLYLQDEAFIKWKPTVINWLFAFACFASHFIGQSTLIQRMMQGGIPLPDKIWIKLNGIWGVFFLLLGFLNLYVVYNFDTDTWVNFKLFGMLGMTIIFIFAQGLYLMKYIDNPVNISDNNN